MSRKVEQGRATRRELVAIATRLFATKGYDATSVDDVLREAGISRGALYHHFAGKDALFEAVLEAVEAKVAETLVEASRGARDPIDALRAGCAAWLRLAQDPTVRQIALVDAPTAVGWRKWREIDERYALGLLKTTLHAAAADGRLRRDSVDVLAHMLLAALAEVALVVARATDPAAAARAGKVAVDQLLDRLLTPKRRTR